MKNKTTGNKKQGRENLGSTTAKNHQKDAKSTDWINIPPEAKNNIIGNIETK